MDARELRIGNSILIDNEIEGVITELRDAYARVRYFGEGIERLSLVSYERLFQIPLTEEWLLKFGFERLDESHFEIKGMKIWICEGMFLCDKTGIQLLSVHWLQNYYFFKNRQELTCK